MYRCSFPSVPVYKKYYQQLRAPGTVVNVVLVGSNSTAPPVGETWTHPSEFKSRTRLRYADISYQVVVFLIALVNKNDVVFTSPVSENIIRITRITCPYPSLKLPCVLAHHTMIGTCKILVSLLQLLPCLQNDCNFPDYMIITVRSALQILIPI